MDLASPPQRPPPPPPRPICAPHKDARTYPAGGAPARRAVPLRLQLPRGGTLFAKRRNWFKRAGGRARGGGGGRAEARAGRRRQRGREVAGKQPPLQFSLSKGQWKGCGRGALKEGGRGLPAPSELQAAKASQTRGCCLGATRIVLRIPHNRPSPRARNTRINISCGLKIDPLPGCQPVPPFLGPVPLPARTPSQQSVCE